MTGPESGSILAVVLPGTTEQVSAVLKLCNATNVGGNRVLRYGMMRDLVLGLEAVLADGGAPPGNLMMHKTGALYGVTSGGGTRYLLSYGYFASNSEVRYPMLQFDTGPGAVFRLTPLSADSNVGWKSVVLHKIDVGTDGKDPVAGRVGDVASNLYGTTSAGSTKKGTCTYIQDHGLA